MLRINYKGQYVDMGENASAQLNLFNSLYDTSGSIGLADTTYPFTIPASKTNQKLFGYPEVIANNSAALRTVYPVTLELGSFITPGNLTFVYAAPTVYSIRVVTGNSNVDLILKNIDIKSLVTNKCIADGLPVLSTGKFKTTKIHYDITSGSDYNNMDYHLFIGTVKISATGYLRSISQPNVDSNFNAMTAAINVLSALLFCTASYSNGNNYILLTSTIPGGLGASLLDISNSEISIILTTPSACTYNWNVTDTTWAQAYGDDIISGANATVAGIQPYRFIPHRNINFYGSDNGFWHGGSGTGIVNYYLNGAFGINYSTSNIFTLGNLFTLVPFVKLSYVMGAIFDYFTNPSAGGIKASATFSLVGGLGLDNTLTIAWPGINGKAISITFDQKNGSGNLGVFVHPYTSGTVSAYYTQVAADLNANGLLAEYFIVTSTGTGISMIARAAGSAYTLAITGANVYISAQTAGIDALPGNNNFKIKCDFLNLAEIDELVLYNNVSIDAGENMKNGSSVQNAFTLVNVFLASFNLGDHVPSMTVYDCINGFCTLFGLMKNFDYANNILNLVPVKDYLANRAWSAKSGERSAGELVDWTGKGEAVDGLDNYELEPPDELSFVLSQTNDSGDKDTVDAYTLQDYIAGDFNDPNFLNRAPVTITTLFATLLMANMVLPDGAGGEAYFLLPFVDQPGNSPLYNSGQTNAYTPRLLFYRGLQNDGPISPATTLQYPLGSSDVSNYAGTVIGAYSLRWGTAYGLYNIFYKDWLNVRLANGRILWNMWLNELDVANLSLTNKVYIDGNIFIIRSLKLTAKTSPEGHYGAMCELVKVN